MPDRPLRAACKAQTVTATLTVWRLRPAVLTAAHTVECSAQMQACYSLFPGRAAC
jgi:hypothetical protein